MKLILLNRISYQRTIKTKTGYRSIVEIYQMVTNILVAKP